MTQQATSNDIESDSADLVAADLQAICRQLSEELPQVAGKRLLITGGAGFLGYYLVQAALHWNTSTAASNRIEVTVYDNFRRGAPQWLLDLKQDPNLTLVKYDVTHPLPAEMDEFSHVIHAAGIASPKYYRLHPLETMDANIVGLRSLLEYCRRRADAQRPVEGMLFLSSSEIYGDPTPDAIPTPETYRGYVSCTGPRACYDESKRYGETLCVTFARQYGVAVKMARPFNNYGPGLKLSDRRVIPDLAGDVLAGRSIVLHSDGSPTRTFCYSADAVVGYYKTLVRGRPGEPYNIGTESPEVSMADLAERVAMIGSELFGYRGQVIHRTSAESDYLVDNPNRRCPDIRKASEELNYEPAVSLEEGLRRSLLWYRDQPAMEES